MKGIGDFKIVAVIPARGGSKTFPRKNLAKLGGKPLVVWTIEASLGSRYIEKTIVSSEDEEILTISKKFGADIIKRPYKYAMDYSRIEPVLVHCLAQLKKRGEDYNVLVLLQPTSPLRNSDDIDRAINLFFKTQAGELISGYEPEKSPYKSFKINNKGFLERLVNNNLPFMSRQSLPKTFYPNGAIYIVYVNEFLRTRKLFGKKTIPFLMSIEKSIDVDTKTDIRKIHKLFKTHA